MLDRVLIRAAVVGDAEAIAELNAEAWRVAFGGVVSADYLVRYDGGPQRRRDELLDMSADAVHFVAVAQRHDESHDHGDGGEPGEGGRVVGWLMAQPSADDDCDPRVYEVLACYVAPAYWRAGIGRRLIRHLVNGLDRDRWREMVLWTPRDAAATRAFYSSLGFLPDGATAVLDRQGPIALVRLRRSLAAVAAGE